MKTIDQMLVGCEHDGSHIPVGEVARLMEEYASQFADQSLTKERVDKLCDVIESSLHSAYLNNGLQLLDFLSQDDPDRTVKTGKEEIKNLVEHIYFDLSAELSPESDPEEPKRLTMREKEPEKGGKEKPLITEQIPDTSVSAKQYKAQSHSDQTIDQMNNEKSAEEILIDFCDMYCQTAMCNICGTETIFKDGVCMKCDSKYQSKDLSLRDELIKFYKYCYGDSAQLIFTINGEKIEAMIDEYLSKK